MNIRYQQTFIDQFAKLSKQQKKLVKETIELFIDDMTHESLRNHPLKAAWAQHHSITADTDLRIHYRTVDSETVLFVVVGSHAELYK